MRFYVWCCGLPHWVNWGEKTQLLGGTVLKLQLWTTWREGTLKRITSGFLLLKTADTRGAAAPSPWVPNAPTQAVVSYLGEGAGMNSCLYLLITCLCQSYFLPETRKQSKMPPIHDNLVKIHGGVGSSFSFFGQPSASGLIELWPHWYPTSLFHIGEISLCAWLICLWCILYYKCGFDLLIVIAKAQGASLPLHTGILLSLSCWFFGYVINPQSALKPMQP